MPQFKFPTLFAAGASATCCFWAIAASAEKPHWNGNVGEATPQSKQKVAAVLADRGTPLKSLPFTLRPMIADDLWAV